MRSIYQLKHIVVPCLALGIICILYSLSRPPTISDSAKDRLASSYEFQKMVLPELITEGTQTIRRVHPSVSNIAAMISFVGASVSLADLDRDGLPNDLIYVDSRVDRVIVAPVPGTGLRYEPFVLDPDGLAFDRSKMAPMGSVVGDYNQDGIADVLVYYWGRSPVIFVQRPAQAIVAKCFVPRELVEPWQLWNTGAVAQADLDGDGSLDLYVANYYPDGSRILDANATDLSREYMFSSLSRAFNGGRDHIFLGSNSGKTTGVASRYQEIENVLEDDVAKGWTFGIAAFHADDDMLPELYLVQDFGPDRLLHNRSKPGEVKFALLEGKRSMNTPRSKVMGGDSFNGMGIDVGDLNQDGRSDLYVSNVTAKFGLHESNFLFLASDSPEVMKCGIAPFRDVSESLGVSRSGWSWGVKFGDFNNDGQLEVIQATGFVRGKVNRWPELQEAALMNDAIVGDARAWHSLGPGDDVSGHEPKMFFVMGEDGRFHNVSDRIGLEDPREPMVTRAIATADVDGDGLLDFALGNHFERSFFYRNSAPKPGKSLILRLLLPYESKDPDKVVTSPGHAPSTIRSWHAVGATATLMYSNGQRAIAQVDGGNGDSGRRSPELHFGLGDVSDSTTVGVNLRWRGIDGKIREHKQDFRPGWHTVLLGDGVELKSEKDIKNE